MKRMLLTGAVLALLLLAGCGTSTAAASTTPTGGTNGAVCVSLGTVHHALASLANAGDTITVGEVQTIQAGLTAAINVLEKVAPASSSAAVAGLKAANDRLAQSLAGLPASDTLGQHGPQLQQFKAQVAQVQAAESQLSTKLHCGA